MWYNAAGCLEVLIVLVQVDIFQDEDGHWCAEGVGHGIVTQGDDLNKLMFNIREACELHFEDEITAGRTIDLLITAKLELNGAASTAG